MTHDAYCPDSFNYQRRNTREVKIGSSALGGNNPIRVQSMTTTDTLDVPATVAQSIRMIEAGCELVRITAPSKRDAEALGAISEGLRAAGHDTPLVADIHFTPNAAEIAADHVEKIRVNPGNYADKKRLKIWSTRTNRTPMNWSASEKNSRRSSKSASDLDGPCGLAPTTAPCRTAS